MTHQDPKLRITAPAQRARGKLHLAVQADSGRTRLKDVRQEGSFRLLFPRQYDHSVEAVTLNTAGGITGGDRFAISAKAGAGTRLTLTTQAAERVYRAAGPDVGRFETALTVADGARLNWLPQETILFDGCALDRRLTVDLAPDAQFLMCEPVVFGRLSSNEVLNTGRFCDGVQITRADRVIYRDAVALSGDIHAQLQRPAIANGAGAMASVVLCHSQAAQMLDATRTLLPHTGGASLLAEDILTIRLLAPDSFVLRQSLCPILTLLTDNALPKTWRL